MKTRFFTAHKTQISNNFPNQFSCELTREAGVYEYTVEGRYSYERS